MIVCSMYKWLCTPIGGAFMIIRPELAERLRPVTPGWAAMVDPMAAPYGIHMRSSLPSGRKFGYGA